MEQTGKAKIARLDLMLFSICWLAYFFTYFGRMNYAACLADMILTQGYSKAIAGLIGTGFFVFYAVGQFISGYVGDYIAPRWMIFTGIFGSGVCNWLMGSSGGISTMIIIWCINGFFQSMIWSPIVRLFAQYFTTETRSTLGIYINSTVPIGTLATYGFTAWILYRTAHWQSVFLFSAVILIATAIAWAIATAYLLPKLSLVEHSSSPQMKSTATVPIGTMILVSGMMWMSLSLMIQGMLKEGITTWIPTFLYEEFSMGTSLGIVMTAVIPFLNILGIGVAAAARKKIGDEVKISCYLFVAGSIALIALYGASFFGALPTMVLFAVATTIMMAVNTVYVGVIPGYFVSVGRSSLVSGVLNGSVNLGIALSTFGFGALAMQWGWSWTMIFWCFSGAVGIVTSWMAYRKWRVYPKQ